MKVYRVSWDAFDGLEHFVFGEDQTEGYAEALKVTNQLAILPRNIKLQEWCGADLQSLCESKTFERLTVPQKIKVLVNTMRDCLTSIGRTTDYISIKHTIDLIESGKL